MAALQGRGGAEAGLGDAAVRLPLQHEGLQQRRGDDLKNHGERVCDQNTLKCIEMYLKRKKNTL